LTWGKAKSGFLEEVQKEFGNELPKKPDLAEDLIPYIRDFEILNSFRTFKDGRPNRITLTDIASFCSLFPVDDKEKFVRIMRSLDLAYLEKSKK